MKRFAILIALFVCSLKLMKAEMPSYVLADGDLCLVHEEGMWFLAQFRSYVHVTDAGIRYQTDDKERRPQSKSFPLPQMGGGKASRENTLMALVDVFQRPFPSEKEARVWKDKEGWDKGTWIKLVLRGPNALTRIDAAENKTAAKKK